MLTAPVRAFLEAMGDPTVQERLLEQAKNAQLSTLLTIARVVQMIPPMVNVERLALGMTTETVEVGDKRQSDASLADRIVQDPVATDLAIQLLDRVSRSSTTVQ